MEIAFCVVILTLLFLVLFTLPISCAHSLKKWPDPSHPPIWPNVFQVDFQEWLDLGHFGGVTRNNGSWYYDYTNHTASCLVNTVTSPGNASIVTEILAIWKFDHLKGQIDVFCQGQGLSPMEPDANCYLLFTKTKDMWVIYPDSKACCWLCGAKEGCTVLKPNWLFGSKFSHVEEIGGRQCAGWWKKGAVTPADTCFVDRHGVLCRYHEVVMETRQPILHNLTFDASTYNTAISDPSVFDIPRYCQKRCPHPFLA